MASPIVLILTRKDILHSADRGVSIDFIHSNLFLMYRVDIPYADQVIFIDCDGATKMLKTTRVWHPVEKTRVLYRPFDGDGTGITCGYVEFANQYELAIRKWKRDDNGQPFTMVTDPVAHDPLKVIDQLSEDDVEWVTNDIAELGVKIGNQLFFLYKGESLVYPPDTIHSAGQPMKWRRVFKREFGECAHPINDQNPRLIGTVSLDDSDDWQVLPANPTK